MGFSLVLVLMGTCRALIWMPYTTRSPHLVGPRLARYTGSVTVHMAVFCLLTGLGLAVAAAVTGLSAGGGQLSGLLAVLAVAAGLMLFREYIRRVYLARMQMSGALLLDIAMAASRSTTTSLNRCSASGPSGAERPTPWTSTRDASTGWRRPTCSAAIGCGVTCVWPGPPPARRTCPDGALRPTEELLYG